MMMTEQFEECLHSQESTFFDLCVNVCVSVSMCSSLLLSTSQSVYSASCLPAARSARLDVRGSLNQSNAKSQYKMCLKTCLMTVPLFTY